MINMCHHAEEDEEGEEEYVPQSLQSRLEVIACLAQAGEELGFDTPMQEPVTQAALAKVGIFFLH